MTNRQLTTPVALFVFNRPHLTEKVFCEIARARPPKLLVVADGPRVNFPNDAEKCASARAVTERVNWECEVYTNYSDLNLGAGRRVSSGLDWAFDIVDKAIILEDDCLPDPSFFPFCEELLDKYRDDQRIMAISGNNFQFGRKRTEYSYYFSRFAHCWGWASWRRAWKHYDFEMKLWPEIRNEKWLYDLLDDKRAVDYWSRLFERTYHGYIDAWDYQLVLSAWLQNCLFIMPNVNLVSNIGFGPEATNTKDPQEKDANVRTEPMIFPISHPPFMMRDSVADQLDQLNLFTVPPLFLRAINRLTKLLSSTFRRKNL